MFVTTTALAKHRREVDAAEAAWLGDLAAYDRSGDWSVDGYASAAAALHHTCNLDFGVAHHYVSVARKLAALPTLAAAYATGDLSHRHVRAITNAHTPARAEAFTAAETELVSVARAHTPKAVAGIVRYLTDAIDGDGGARADTAEYERRAFYLATTLQGRCDLRGSCDPLIGELIIEALDAEMARDHQPGDTRATPTRRLDAMANLCRHALQRGELGEQHGVTPHITATIHLAPTDRLNAEQPRGDEPIGLTGRVRRELRHHGHLSAHLLELLTCDCTLSRVIIAGRSEVLDVGRATATVTPAQWKALVARDRHCQAPGCSRPPADCQAHHIHHWARGGLTNLDNLSLD